MEEFGGETLLAKLGLGMLKWLKRFSTDHRPVVRGRDTFSPDLLPGELDKGEWLLQGTFSTQVPYDLDCVSKWCRAEQLVLSVRYSHCVLSDNFTSGWLVLFFDLKGYTCIPTACSYFFLLEGTEIGCSETALPCESGDSQEICSKSVFLSQIKHECSCTQGTEHAELKTWGRKSPSNVSRESAWQGKHLLMILIPPSKSEGYTVFSVLNS